MKLITVWSLRALLVVLCAAKCASAVLSSSSPFHVWQVQDGGGGGGTLDARSTTQPAENKVRVDHQGLIATLSGSVGEAAAVVLSFILPDEVLECVMVPSQLMAPQLQEMYPEIKVFVGQCSNDGSAIMVVNENQANSMSTTLYNHRGEVFYVDHNKDEADSEIYTLVNRKDLIPPEGAPSWSDTVVVHGRRLDKRLRMPATGRALQSLKGVMYRMALATTKEYSQRYGNTRATVLQELVRGMARVNGIYLRELGVMFQLIAETANLICLNGEPDCSYLNNGNDGTLIGQTTTYITNVRNVTISLFDIGHIFSTSGGGLASLSSVCDSNRKAWGVTGLNTAQSSSDAFFVDYVAHEVSLESFCGATRGRQTCALTFCRLNNLPDRTPNGCEPRLPKLWK